MAQLSTFATTASNVAVDADERRITISSEVVEIDGTLDPPTGFSDWGGWEIICQSSGGFRSTSGASGTLGGGKHSLKIVEKTNGHRFGGDSFSVSNGANARFAGDGTNLLKYHNIVWIVETGDRSDFDIGRGTQTDGSAGPKVELSGVSLYQLTETGQTAHFNHYSGQASIKIHPEVGYGLRVENRTNGHAVEFSTAIQTGAVVEGLVVVNLASPTNNGAASNARVAVRLAGVATNGSLTLSNLNTPSITDVDGGTNAGSKTLVLVDPVGKPTITNNWNRHVLIEIRRTVPFEFTGAEPSGETMHGIAAVGGQNATGAMTGSTGSIVLRTQITANAQATTFTDRNTYRFFMTGLGFRKYSLTTNQVIGDVPSAITANLTPDTLPDGSAISSITAPTSANPPDTLAEVIRAIKDVEVANPVTSGYPTDSLAYVDGNAVKINDAYSLDLKSANSNLILVETDPNGIGGRHIDLKTGTTLGDANGLTTIEATGTGKVITKFSVTEDSDVFLLDSSGQKTNVTITNNLGASALFTLIKTSDGTSTGSETIASDSSGTIAVATKGLGTGYRVVAKRVGYRYYSAPVDLTGGGSRTLTAEEQGQLLQPDGVVSYISTASTSGLVVEDVSSGSTPGLRIGIGNETYTAAVCFKAVEDFLATASGAKFMGLGGGQVDYLRSSLNGDQVYLGAHAKVRRHATQNANAAIRASLFSNDQQPVDNVRGDVQTIEGLNLPAVTSAIWSAGTRTLTSGGGGGSTLTAQQVWEYSTRSLSTSPPTAASIASAVWSSDDAVDAPPTAASVASAVWSASARTTTDAAPPSAADISNEVWAAIVDGGITEDLTITPEAEAGDGFRIPADDAALISNGDPFQFTATGGYSNLTTTETYYAYVSSGVLYVYGSRHNAVTPGSPWIQPSGGTLADVRIVFVGKRPVGTAGVALHRILAAIVELDNDHASHSQATEAIGVLMNRLLGSNYIEQGYSLAETMQIVLAILAGRIEVTNAGRTLTFHRLATGEPAVIRGDVSDLGRTSPTRNPVDTPPV